MDGTDAVVEKGDLLLVLRWNVRPVHHGVGEKKEEWILRAAIRL